jgi:hypothetical protein
MTYYMLLLRTFSLWSAALVVTMPAMPRYGEQAGEGQVCTMPCSHVWLLLGGSKGCRGGRRGLAVRSTTRACGHSGRWPCARCRRDSCGGGGRSAGRALPSVLNTCREMSSHSKGGPTLASFGMH